MKILYASKRPPYPLFLGGAARCAHEIMHTLTNNFSIECAAIGSADFSNPPWSFPDKKSYETLGIRTLEDKGITGKIDCGYPVEVISDFQNSLGEYIDHYQPDIIWTQMEGAQTVIEIADKKCIHSVLFVHDAEFNPKELKIIAEMTSGIVCSSHFLARKIHKAIKYKAQVVYPCPKVDFNVVGDVDGYITMINPHRVKGLDTFLKVAEQLPEQRFLLVESWKLTDSALAELKEQLLSLPHVKFIRRVSDMGDVYRQTKLLLAPSVWEEGFGMVVVEAQSCRIPVIASNRGGLTEAVGHGGILIDDYQNPKTWISELTRLLNDDVVYRDFAQLAYENAHKEVFSITGSSERFLKYCSQITATEFALRNKNSLFSRFKRLFG